MSISLYIRKDQAPALGDIRSLFPGCVVYIAPDAPQLADWGRYLDAIGHAVGRGADVKWLQR